jgi:hypothetical protein
MSTFDQTAECSSLTMLILSVAEPELLARVTAR